MWIDAARQSPRGRCALALAGLLALAAPAAGAETEAEAERAAARQETPARAPGFLFGQPDGSLGLRVYQHRARADSDLHDFMTELLTLERRDFRAFGIGVDLGFAVTPRLDIRVSVDYARTPAAESEYRGFVGSDDRPIKQETTLAQTDVSGSITFALAPRGRAIGQYAWIPSAIVPYIGAGAGSMRHGLDVVGDFIEEDTDYIDDDHLWSRGWTRSVHFLGGVDIRLTSRLYATWETRYVLAADDPADAFEAFDSLDLSGTQMAGGIRLLF